MNTKYLMMASSLLLGAIGVLLTFLPHEISAAIKSVDTDPIILQIVGALYFGFAMLNWTAKDNLIGGIYGRPITIGNMTHFIVAGLALVKFAFRNASPLMWVIAILYAFFALSFGYIFMNHPKSKK
ncbi:hypothetical protein [Fulvivirga lutimaris]|uniref:hypothetical protein n=1 Tax=Fulvivirga lutimaris TaxID=1819566 RepID=UPI0012BCE925|nr:hypothetical protein [Fulvivirga lutimaris]MTI40411.1 hypothetical protein [Fulvivirga lutimaris]